MRTATIARKTNETDINLSLNLDGGNVSISTGIGFFDHMLNSFAVHGGFGLELVCDGDLRVDGHHSVEDTGIVLGRAFASALGEKRGIKRFGSAFIPMDEALAECHTDVSGRGFLLLDADFDNSAIGGYDTCLTKEFFRAFAVNAGITLHLRSSYGENDHHKTEALFKAAAHALKAAVALSAEETALSTKGTLS